MVLIRAMRIIGFVFRPLGKPVNYFGAATLPAVITLADANHKLRYLNSSLYQWLNNTDGNMGIFDLEKPASLKWQRSIPTTF
jgi:hypothetical protein